MFIDYSDHKGYKPREHKEVGYRGETQHHLRCDALTRVDRVAVQVDSKSVAIQAQREWIKVF